MKLTSNEETLAESKALILYILNSINKPITNNALYKIILSVLDMNYFYFQQFLLDLVKSDFIKKKKKEEQHLYLITEKGKRTLELTEDIVPGILKLQVDTNLKYALDGVDEENSIIAEYTPIRENYYNVTCKIMENNECLFEVKSFAGSREQAKQIVNNWKKHAGTIYPNLLDILTQDYGDSNSEEESIASAPEIIGSPRDVYNYDVINRASIDDDTSKDDEVNSNDNSNSNTLTSPSDVIEGNMNLFDIMDQKK